MPALDFETDQFLVLLSEALRRGPASPEWQEALQQLDADGPATAAATLTQSDAGELRALLTARDRLESGRAYRQVSAGPGFTSDLMQKLREERDGKAAPARPRARLTLVIAAACAIAAIVAGVIIVVSLNRSPAGPPDPVLALREIYFVKPVIEQQFVGRAIESWKSAGSMVFRSWQGLRGQGAQGASFPVGGVVWSATPLPSDRPISIEATLDCRRSTPDGIVQLFITDNPTFAGEIWTSPSELTWMLQNNRTRLLTATGRQVAQGTLQNGREATVRVRLDATVAVVEVDGRPFWSGPHGLSAGHPRFVGFRFVQSGNNAGDVRVQSLRVLEQ